MNRPDISRPAPFCPRYLLMIEADPALYAQFTNVKAKPVKDKDLTSSHSAMYVDYIQRSQLIHGSSIESNLFFHENSFSPSISNRSATDIAKAICNECMSNLMGLKILQSAL